MGLRTSLQIFVHLSSKIVYCFFRAFLILMNLEAQIIPIPVNWIVYTNSIICKFVLLASSFLFIQE